MVEFNQWHIEDITLDLDSNTQGSIPVIYGRQGDKDGILCNIELTQQGIPVQQSWFTGKRVFYEARGNGVSIRKEVDAIVEGIVKVVIPEEAFTSIGLVKDNFLRVEDASTGETIISGTTSFNLYVRQGNLDPEARSFYLEEVEDLVTEFYKWMRSVQKNVTSDVGTSLLNRQTLLQQYVDSLNLETIEARETYSSLSERFDAIEQEVSQKSELSQTRLLSEPIGKDDIDGELLGIIQGTAPTPVNVYSIPRKGSVTPETTNFIRNSKNLFDNRQIQIDGFLNYDTGQIGVLSGYITGVTYIRAYKDQPMVLQNARVYVLYDNEFVRYKGINTGSNSGTSVITPDRDGWLRVTAHSSMLSKLMVEYGNSPSEYESFGMSFYRINFNDEQKHEIKSLVFDALDNLPLPSDIRVIKSGNFISLTGDFGDGREISMDLLTDGSSNGSFRTVQTIVDGNIIHLTSDDITPIRTNIATVGANHGYTNIIQITMTDHGKTQEDLGSIWSDGTNQYTLLQINGPLLIFGCAYTVENDMTYSARIAPTANLNHVSGATNVTPVSIATVASSSQLYPSINKLSLKFKLDGKEIKEDGTYYGNAFQVEESYNVMDYKSIIDYAQNNIGKDFAKGDIEGLVNLLNVFTFTKGLNCTTSHSMRALKKVQLGRCGFLQSAAMSLAGHTLKRWLPGVKLKSGIDFASGVDMTSYATSLLYLEADNTIANTPPNHSIDWLLDGSGKKRYGFTMGYIVDKTDSSNQDRTSNTSVFWDMRSTKKQYPNAFEGLLEVGEYINFQGFRNYLNPSLTKSATCATEVIDASGTYLYVDYNQSQSAEAFPFTSHIGKEIEEVQNKDLQMLNTVVDASGIVIKSTSNQASGIFKL